MTSHLHPRADHHRHHKVSLIALALLFYAIVLVIIGLVQLAHGDTQPWLLVIGAALGPLAILSLRS